MNRPLPVLEHMPHSAVASGIDLDASPYQGYLYSYPHKLAYRGLEPEPPLREVWQGEQLDALFLYAHIPFCEMRCGFCNLFTRTHPPAEQVEAYLDALARQATAVRAELDAVGAPRFAGAAIGGGTPTYLSAEQLARLTAICESIAPGYRGLGAAVETSPATATAERIAVLEEAGCGRISMGVQSFIDAEAHAAGRPQRRATVDAAITRLRDSRIPVVNLDLIYGIPGQTMQNWEYSLRCVIDAAPEEIYLYPLYIRPETGLGRHGRGGQPGDTTRLDMYRRGRDMLRAAGYEQHSMRQFQLRPDRRTRATLPAPAAPAAAAPDREFACQRDGTIGLGCGARSYTTGLHYSFDYAVGVSAVRSIIDEYCRETDFSRARFGYRMDAAEQARRWLIISLLTTDGLDLAEYRAQFDATAPGAVSANLAYLQPLVERGWAELTDGRARLTAAGVERSDAIGPWLISPLVRAAMAERELR